MKRWILFLCSISTILALGGCSWKSNTEPKKPIIMHEVGSCNMQQQSEYKTIPFE